MGDLKFILILCICLAIIAVIRILATKDFLLGRICRWFWNVGFKIAAHIPFCGWMAHFIVADNEQSKREREHYINVGKQSDNMGTNWAKQSAQRAKAEEAAYQARLQQEAQARKDLESDLRRRAYRNYGRTDVQLNSDGSMVKIGDGDYVKVDEFKHNAPL